MPRSIFCKTSGVFLEPEIPFRKILRLTKIGILLPCDTYQIDKDHDQTIFPMLDSFLSRTLDEMVASMYTTLQVQVL